MTNNHHLIVNEPFNLDSRAHRGRAAGRVAAPPWKVLLMTVDDGRKAALERERREISEALGRSKTFVIQDAPAVSFDAAIAALDDQSPDFVHLMGHGDGSGAVGFVGEAAVPHAIQPEQLSRLFAALPTRPQLVVFSLCHSELLAMSASRHAAFALGFEGLVEDGPRLRQFFRVLYDRLSAREPIDIARAFTFAQISLGDDLGIQPRLFEDGVVVAPVRALQTSRSSRGEPELRSRPPLAAGRRSPKPASYEFTPEQQRAIDHREGNLQLIACAGSGKTEVLANRVAKLLDPNPPPNERRYLPRNIVAFTFTEKAAGELKERIVRRVEQRYGVDTIVGMAEMFVGTIHAFCLDLLQNEVPEFLKYAVLNEVQQVLLVNRNSRTSGLTQTTTNDGKPLKRYVDTSRYIQCMSILREARIDRAALSSSTIADGFDAYQALLDRKNYFDYTAILARAVACVEDDAAVRARLAERLRHVIVDEYQDLNPVQERLIRALHELGAHLCVVGDDDQTIYQWRGSDVEQILSFARRYPGRAARGGVQQITLAENFRSSEAIVSIAREFIAKNTARLPKAMQTTQAQPFEKGDVCALAFDSDEEEAAWLVSTIARLRGVAFADADGVRRGLAYSDMAILLRSVRNNGPVITDALRAAGIPFVISGMNKLFESPEAEAARLLFYFIARAQEIDERALFEAWRRAALGVSEDALRRAIAEAAATRAQLADAPDEQRWATYNIQRTYKRFLATIELREEQIPGEPDSSDRGEIVFYNLGRFSQLISDFESIHFHSRPSAKYETFARFLLHQAEHAYPEGGQDVAFASPDAVRIMTVHQAKGMQWPVVFLPALLRNRFPAAGGRGRQPWHIIPPGAVAGFDRYRGSFEDERRLFYVAITRAQKFLFMTWGPVPGKRNFQRASTFWDDVLVSKYVKRRPPQLRQRARLPPQPKRSVANVSLTFSDLKYFFICPYQFKLRMLYGFNAPLEEALGYGKSLHDALAEVHARAIEGDIACPSEAPELVERHLNVPYAYPSLREDLREAGIAAIADYIEANVLTDVEFSEKSIELNLGNGVRVSGRIDLVRRIATDDVSIVDLKSTHRAQDENLTDDQLHIYALGYRELTGRDADFVEIYNLDAGERKPRSIDEDIIEEVQERVHEAALALRTNDSPPGRG